MYFISTIPCNLHVLYPLGCPKSLQSALYSKCTLFPQSWLSSAVSDPVSHCQLSLLFCWRLFTSTHTYTRGWKTPDRWLCHFTFLKTGRTFLGPWCKTWVTWVFWCVFVKCIVIYFFKVWILILTHCQGQRCRATHTPNVGYKQYVYSGAGWLLFSGFVCS